MRGPVGSEAARVTRATALPLGREPSPATPSDLEAMRRRVWREQGVVALRLEDITDPWLRQALTNEAMRSGGMTHGR